MAPTRDGYEQIGDVDLLMHCQMQVQALVFPIPFSPSSIYSNILSALRKPAYQRSPESPLTIDGFGEEEQEEEEKVCLVGPSSPRPTMSSEVPCCSNTATASPNSNEFSNCNKRIRMNRPVYSNSTVYSSYPNFSAEADSPSVDISKKTRNLFENVQNNCSCSLLGILTTLFPILTWLPSYKWKNDLPYDLLAGFTVAVMHIPQGMAYAQLGNLPPIVGIYMGFFPVIVYALVGTSRHVSMGTFAVVCLMTGKVILEKSGDHTFQPSVSNLDVANTEYSKYSVVEIATAISLTVGLWQVLMSIFRLGSLSLLLSSELVSGFTTGAAIHVLTSQVKNVLGISVPAREGIFKIPLMWLDICENIETCNPAAVLLSFVTLTTLIVYNELLKPLLSKTVNFPLPMEFITIIVGTLTSMYMNFAKRYGIDVVDSIPTGFPAPRLPPCEIIPPLILDSLIIATVAYVVTVSMAKIFAVKHNYEISANQELFANGASNIAGSFFSCAPISASLSRSLIQDQVGGRSQLAGLFSCLILVSVLLWIGPFFETLPKCILSSIIIVALKGMVLQVRDLKTAGQLSIINGLIWLISFLSTIILDIEYGLGIGLILSIISLIWRSNKPYISILGTYNNSDVYVDIHKVGQAKEIPGVKIIKYTGSLNFVTVEKFVAKFSKIVPDSGESTTTNVQLTKSLFAPGKLCSTVPTDKSINNYSAISGLNTTAQVQEDTKVISWIILDMSGVSSVDPAALASIKATYDRYLKKDIQILFSCCPVPVLDSMSYCDLIKHVGPKKFFPTIHDAVVFCADETMLPVTSLEYQESGSSVPVKDTSIIFHDNTYLENGLSEVF